MIRITTLVRAAAALSSLIAGTAALAQANPDKITLCHANEESYPWLINSKPGYSPMMIQSVEKQLGVTIKLVALPWKQCLADVKSNAVDGAINASFAADRAEYAVYPLKLDGEADATKRMYRATYALYRPKGSAVAFDGSKLSGIDGIVIGAPNGYSVVAQLTKLGAKVDDSAKATTDILKRVVAGKFGAAALQTTEAEDTLHDEPDIKAKIERVSPPLAEKPYFTIFSKGFFGKYGNTAREVWKLQAKTRDSAEFKAQVAHLVKAVD
jgi:polar amino acid transport system substrate-binding protein